MILIHGAGGYGHPPAKRYLVKQGWRNQGNAISAGNTGSEATKKHALTEQDQKFGFSSTRQQVLNLHQHLLQRLQSFGLPVVTVSAFDHVQTKEGEPTRESSRRLALRVQHLLSLGFIPLLFGDAVFDLTWGCTILSGDVIMYQLAMYLPHGVDRCVFVTDVQGIYTDDPKKKQGNATLIKHIPVGHVAHDDSKLVLPPVKVGDDEQAPGGMIDVTGGMNGKIKWIKKIILDSSVSEVVVCQAGSSEMYHALTLAPISVSPGNGDEGNNTDLAPSLDRLSLTLFTGNRITPLLDTSLLSSTLLHYLIFTVTLYHIVL
ncbi:unnamed protein product [Absidia cylindrospora]